MDLLMRRGMGTFLGAVCNPTILDHQNGYGLNRIRSVECAPPDNAYFALRDISRSLGAIIVFSCPA